MKTKHELVCDWIKKAENDFKTAQRGLTFPDPVTDTICFHCQQVVEKYLKAYLLMNEVDFPFTHNIEVLIRLCEDIDPQFKEIIDADTLTPYAVEIRYLVEEAEPTGEEAKEAFEMAKKVKEFVRGKINLN